MEFPYRKEFKMATGIIFKEKRKYNRQIAIRAEILVFGFLLNEKQ